MKTKSIILVGVAALVTLSFTFASVAKQDKHQTSSSSSSTHQSAQNEPAGGFVAEEIVK